MMARKIKHRLRGGFGGVDDRGCEEMCKNRRRGREVVREKGRRLKEPEGGDRGFGYEI